MDSGLGFLVGQLTHVESKLYEVQYPEITYPQVMPVSTEAGEWATSITYFSMDGAGVAKWIGSKANDVPLVDLSSKKTVVPVELGGIGYDYSLEELRQAQHLNRPLPQLKANTARRGYEEFAQRVAMYGDADAGYEGFVNNSNVATENVVAGVSTDTKWSEKTPAEILFDVNTALSDVNVDSETVESPDTLALPAAQWDYIMGTPRSDNSDTTIAQYIATNSPYLTGIDKIVKLKELKGAGAGGTDRMIAYTNSIEKFKFHIPMPLRFLAPQPKGYSFVVPGEFKIAGTEFMFIGSLCYRDGI